MLAAVRTRFPWLRHVFADGGYAGDKLRSALVGRGKWTIDIIKRSDSAKGFEVLPRRWVLERTFAWLGRCRRLAKDWEKSIASSTAWALIASIRRTIARLMTIERNDLTKAETLTVAAVETRVRALASERICGLWSAEITGYGQGRRLKTGYKGRDIR